jgi:hypothetical protein
VARCCNEEVELSFDPYISVSESSCNSRDGRATGAAAALLVVSSTAICAEASLIPASLDFSEVSVCSRTAEILRVAFSADAAGFSVVAEASSPRTALGSEMQIASLLGAKLFDGGDDGKGRLSLIFEV